MSNEPRRNATPAEPSPIPHSTLPLYKCHKLVRAAKIRRIRNDGYRFLLAFEDSVDNLYVSPAWVDNHGPVVGGYFVVYEDGYTSYSPAEAFEKGYRLVDQAAREKGKAREVFPQFFAGIDLDKGFMGFMNSLDKTRESASGIDGLRPRSAVLKARRREIECAIGRACNQKRDFPVEWVQEYIAIVKEILGDPKRRSNV